MPFLILNNERIIDIVKNAGDVEVQSSELIDIIANPFGHKVFDYVGGAIVLNQIRMDNNILEYEKQSYINELVENEVVLMAQERLTGQINAVENAADIGALNSMRGIGQ